MELGFAKLFGEGTDQILVIRGTTNEDDMPCIRIMACVPGDIDTNAESIGRYKSRKKRDEAFESMTHEIASRIAEAIRKPLIAFAEDE